MSPSMGALLFLDPDTYPDYLAEYMKIAQNMKRNSWVKKILLLRDSRSLVLANLAK